MTKYFFIGLILIFGLLGLVACAPGAIAASTVQPESTAPAIIPATSALIQQSNPAPSNQSPTPGPGYKDVGYMIEGQLMTLQNGVSTTHDPNDPSIETVTRYFGNDAFGDLNGDGKEDVAFLLTQNSGGSGTFYYVVVALKTDASYIGTNAIFLGDRIAPQSTSIEKGLVIVNYADRKLDEPFTALPSVGVTTYLKVEGDSLTEVTP